MKVFISYCHEDAETAVDLLHELRERGVDCWLDRDRLLPGSTWKQDIEGAIAGSAYFLALVSKNYLARRSFGRQELELALDIQENLAIGEVFVIPVRLDESKTDYQPLDAMQWVDFFPSRDQGLSRLLALLKPEIDLNPTDEESSVLSDLDLGPRLLVLAKLTLERILSNSLLSKVELIAHQDLTLLGRAMLLLTRCVRGFLILFYAIPLLLVSCGIAVMGLVCLGILLSIIGIISTTPPDAVVKAAVIPFCVATTVSFAVLSYVELKTATFQKIKEVDFLFIILIVVGGVLGNLAGDIAQAFGATTDSEVLGCFGAFLLCAGFSLLLFERIGKASLWSGTICVKIAPNPAPAPDGWRRR